MKKGVRVEAKAGESPIIDIGSAASTAVTWPSDATAFTLLDGFTIRGGTGKVLHLKGDGRILNCTVDGETTSSLTGIQIDGESFPEVISTTITMEGAGSRGVFVSSHAGPHWLTIDSCTVDVDECGVAIYGSPETVDYVYMDNTDITVDQGFGVDVQNAGRVSIRNTTVQVTTSNSLNVGIGFLGVDGTADYDAIDCLVSAPGGNGVDFDADDTILQRVTIDDVDRGIVGVGSPAPDGDISHCIVSDWSTNAFSNVDTLDYCIADGTNPFGSIPGTGNENETPLYCDGNGGDYTLRVDSYGNPENNPSGEQVGAFGVACAYGTLARDTEFSDGTLAFTGDLEIPSGKTLTLSGSGAGNDVFFEASDSDGGNLGADPNLVELIVADGGALDVSPTSSATVTFTSASASPAEGDWVGILVQDGADLTFSDATVEYAQYGINVQTRETAAVSDNTFLSNESVDIAIGNGTGNMDLTVADNTITVGGGVGVYLASESSRDIVDGAVVEDNTITAGSASTAGIQMTIYATGETPTIEGNTVTGASVGAGILIEAGDPLLYDNTLTGNKWGIKVTQGSPVIGNASASADANTISSNTTGVLAEDSLATPTIRQNTIDSNTYGVVAKSGGYPNLGTGPGAKGNNKITNSGTYCVWNRNTSGSIPARFNYFGACVLGNPPVCAFGSVDVSNGLCTAPFSTSWDMVHTPAAPAGFRLLGAVPNPLRGAGAIQFRLEEGRTDVTVQIFDLAGRLVRDLGTHTVAAGDHHVHWDGLTAMGAPVGNGIYFVRIADGGAIHEATKILVTR